MAKRKGKKWLVRLTVLLALAVVCAVGWDALRPLVMAETTPVYAQYLSLIHIWEVWHLDVGSSHPGAEAGPKGLAVRQLKRHASWVQNVVRQFGPYLLSLIHI